MGCCKNIIGSLVCIVILCGAGVVAYLYGPWNKENGGGAGGGDSEDTTTTLIGKSSDCENCCNGLESNCNRPINEVTWAMVHNAMSAEENSFYAANNDLSLEKALVAGYRGLMLDSCLCDGDTIVDIVTDYISGNDNGEKSEEELYLGFCHGTCAAGERKPSTVLNNIKTFLELNPNEVIILEFEVGEGSLEQLKQAVEESGLDKYAFRDVDTDGNVTKWPTFQELIDANQRVLLFAHNGGMKHCSMVTCPEGFFYTYDHFSQTDWNDETCELKGDDPYLAQNGFFLMNHWKNSRQNGLELPSKSNAEEFNTYESISNRFGTCEQRLPNVVAVDFWSIGDLLEFVEDQNTNTASDGKENGKENGKEDVVVAESRSGSLRQ